MHSKAQRCNSIFSEDLYGAAGASTVSCSLAIEHHIS